MSTETTAEWDMPTLTAGELIERLQQVSAETPVLTDCCEWLPHRAIDTDVETYGDIDHFVVNIEPWSFEAASREFEARRKGEQ